MSHNVASRLGPGLRNRSRRSIYFQDGTRSFSTGLSFLAGIISKLAGGGIRFNNFLFGSGRLADIERELADLDGIGVLDVLDLELLILQALE